jgi:hypothetical protein
MQNLGHSINVPATGDESRVTIIPKEHCLHNYTGWLGGDDYFGIMQGDGNFVVYKGKEGKDRRVMAASNTDGSDVTHLALFSNGKVALRNDAGHIVKVLAEPWPRVFAGKWELKLFEGEKLMRFIHGGKVRARDLPGICGYISTSTRLM